MLIHFLTGSHLVFPLFSNHTLRKKIFYLMIRNVVIKDLTILAPVNAPNTDGIDPDSSSEVCVEDCYIGVSGSMVYGPGKRQSTIGPLDCLEARGASPSLQLPS